MRPQAAILLLAAGFSACAAAPALPRGSVELGRYEILPPEGPGWTATLGSGEALFLNRKDPPWHGAGFTLIRVFPVPLQASPELEPGLLALRAFARVEAELLEKSERERRFRLTDVHKEALTIGDKTLHRMSYRVLQETVHPEGEPWLARVERYLYFPPDFPKHRVAYAFVIADLHAVGVLGERGSLRSIVPLIENFRLKETPRPAEEPRPEATP